jgi:hypothetical protein
MARFTGPVGGGGAADLGDFTFTDNIATVQNAQNMIFNATNGEDFSTKAQLVLDPNNYAARLIATDSFRTDDFTTSDWESATWTTDGGSGSYISFVNALWLLEFLEDTVSNQGNVKILVNGSFLGDYNYYSSASPDVTIYISNLGPSEDPTVSSIQFQYTPSSKIEIDYDEGDILIDGKGLDVIVRSDDDVYIEAGGDDLFLRASDDIRFTANWDNNEGSYGWRMESNGQFQLPGDGYISNPIDSSGDGSGNDTMRLVPDSNLDSDQYIILDPTTPNHIHIRAGGTIDESTADLILGGEKNNVVISDNARDVFINTRPDTVINSYTNLNDVSSSAFVVDASADISYGAVVNVDGTDYIVDSISGDTPMQGQLTIMASGATFTAGQSYTFTFNAPWTNSWQFDSDATLYGPLEGLVKTPGLYGTNDGPLSLIGPQGVVLDGDSGEFLNDSSVPTNQIATLGDIGVETSYAVQGGTDGTQPTFTGDPLFSASYVRMSSNLVHFQIQVDMDNITSFGTGQYYMTLPFDAKTNYIFRDGCVHDVSTGKEYHISGHVAAGSNELILFSSAKDGNSVEDVAFTPTVPFALATDDNFHIAGTYIAEVAL